LKTAPITALALALALALGAPLPAQEGRTWAEAQGAYLWQNHGSQIQDDPALGLAAGHWLSNRWGGELSVLGSELHSRLGAVSRNETQFNGSALLDLAPASCVGLPYLRMGAGATRLALPLQGQPYEGSVGGSTLRLNLHGGLGLQRTFAGHWIASGEARVTWIQGVQQRTESAVLLGLGCSWGGAAPAGAAPAPAPEPMSEPVAEPVAAPAPEPAPEPVAAPAPEPAPAPVAASPLPAKVVLDEAVLHFANGRTVLSQEGRAAIRKVASSLQAYPGAFALVVSGHTSSVGSAAFNRALSLRRAQAVARVLAEAGIPATAIHTLGLGADRPVASSGEPDVEARNRRVEIGIRTAGAPVETRRTETGTVQD
jgi:OOP family OmpA-OmpF porin